MADKQSLCIDILVSGHVQAYVDFFYLTHRPEVDAPEGDDAEEPEETPTADEQVGTSPGVGCQLRLLIGILTECAPLSTVDPA